MAKARFAGKRVSSRAARRLYTIFTKRHAQLHLSFTPCREHLRMKAKSPLLLIAVLGFSATTFAQDAPIKIQAQRHRARARAVPVSPVANFGDPLPDLTAEQNAAFGAGLEEFQNAETIESGLGPTFNNASCVACHSNPGIGGSSAITVSRFGRLVNGQYDSLAALGGSLFQQNAIDMGAQEQIPKEANVIAHRQTTPLFGLGLIEAIPDREILRNAQRTAIHGIKGRAAIVQDVVSGQMRVGKFGWKAQQATLLAFAGDAYLNEMGITNRFFPNENAPNGDTAKLAQFDQVADPEDQVDPDTGKSDIDVVADFMRFLAPPPSSVLSAKLSPSANNGRNLFHQLDCAVCHKPAMFTGANPIAALSSKQVPLFSDLLLHDMGTLGDGIVQGAAGPDEMRTAPLWGLRDSAPYLHDGRATTVDDAIRMHDGEAAESRDRYIQLT